MHVLVARLAREDQVRAEHGPVLVQRHAPGERPRAAGRRRTGPQPGLERVVVCVVQLLQLGVDRGAFPRAHGAAARVLLELAQLALHRSALLVHQCAPLALREPLPVPGHLLALLGAADRQCAPARRGRGARHVGRVQRMVPPGAAERGAAAARPRARRAPRRAPRRAGRRHAGAGREAHRELARRARRGRRRRRAGARGPRRRARALGQRHRRRHIGRRRRAARQGAQLVRGRRRQRRLRVRGCRGTRCLLLLLLLLLRRGLGLHRVLGGVLLAEPRGDVERLGGELVAVKLALARVPVLVVLLQLVHQDQRPVAAVLAGRHRGGLHPGRRAERAAPARRRPHAVKQLGVAPGAEPLRGMRRLCKLLRHGDHGLRRGGPPAGRGGAAVAVRQLAERERVADERAQVRGQRRPVRIVIRERAGVRLDPPV